MADADQRTDEPTPSYRVLATRLKKDPELQRRFREDPVGAAESLGAGARDPLPLRLLLVVTLGVIALTCIGGMIWIGKDREIPESLVAIAAAAVGALAAVLTGRGGG